MEKDFFIGFSGVYIPNVLILAFLPEFLLGYCVNGSI
jgi:hypothetical protein